MQFLVRGSVSGAERPRAIRLVPYGSVAAVRIGHGDSAVDVALAFNTAARARRDERRRSADVFGRSDRQRQQPVVLLPNGSHRRLQETGGRGNVER